MENHWFPVSNSVHLCKVWGLPWFPLVGPTPWGQVLALSPAETCRKTTAEPCFHVYVLKIWLKSHQIHIKNHENHMKNHQKTSRIIRNYEESSKKWRIIKNHEALGGCWFFGILGSSQIHLRVSSFTASGPRERKALRMRSRSSVAPDARGVGVFFRGSLLY